MTFFRKNRTVCLGMAMLLVAQPAVQAISFSSPQQKRAFDILKDNLFAAAHRFNSNLSQAVQQELMATLTGQPAQPVKPLNIAKATLLGMPHYFMQKQVTSGALYAASALWGIHRNPNHFSLAQTGIGLGYGFLSGMATPVRQKMSLLQKAKLVACSLVPSICIGLTSDLAQQSVTRLAAKAGLQKPQFLQKLDDKLNPDNPSRGSFLKAIGLLIALPAGTAAIHGMIWNKALSFLWGIGMRQQAQTLMAARMQKMRAMAAQQQRYPAMYAR